MASTTLTSGDQKLELMYFDNMHINSYVFNVADHENELRLNINIIGGCIWLLQY